MTDVPEAHVLVVDDDARLRALLQRYLAEQGFRVTTAGHAAEAREVMRAMQPDLLVLDVMMPGLDGIATCRELRRTSRVPVLFLSSRTDEVDRIVGLEVGGDDYLGKPFEPRELVLRLRAMLRRVVPPPAAPAGPVRLGALEFDAARAELRGPGGIVHLTGGEGALLQALAHRPGEVLSREWIAETLGMDETGERAIDVQVTRLRRKIEADPREPRFLHTVRGRGYVLKPGI